ncbi:MAG: hypothetical protein QNJ53_14015 [Pleurocapsa sp. MO_192.B19]|nr:hypothetical protein [Pleurocapsa sp. MO_192.B19]
MVELTKEQLEAIALWWASVTTNPQLKLIELKEEIMFQPKGEKFIHRRQGQIN